MSMAGYWRLNGEIYCCGTQTNQFEQEMENMSSKNTNQLNIPEAREAMDQFKMEAARDLGVFVPPKSPGRLSILQVCGL